MTQEKIQQYLTEIGEYFKSKLIAGEFEFVSCNEYVAKIKIDGHPFLIWIANKPSTSLRFYSYHNFEDSLFRGYLELNENERTESWSNLKPHVNSYKRETLIKEKREELKKLEQELKEE